RALNAGIPAYVVDPELFPNITSHSMAVANKLKDMDIDLVILAGYELPLGVVPYQYKNRIIGTYPALYPAFENEEGDIYRAALEKGVKVTGATAYFADGDGRVGNII
ncbi:phosphoribosylglycinamide formyltransferase, partial [gut metagenome]